MHIQLQLGIIFHKCFISTSLCDLSSDCVTLVLFQLVFAVVELFVLARCRMKHWIGDFLQCFRLMRKRIKISTHICGHQSSPPPDIRGAFRTKEFACGSYLSWDVVQRWCWELSNCPFTVFFWQCESAPVFPNSFACNEKLDDTVSKHFLVS